MSDPVSLGPIVNIWDAGSQAFRGSEGEKGVSKGSGSQAATWLPPVPPGESTYGVCPLPVIAAPGDDGLCELEYDSLPPVCPADDEAAAADAAKARWKVLECPTNKDMPACPGQWNDAVPVGWKIYEGKPSVFHCGFRGLVADCSPDRDHLQNECFYHGFYNDAGQLVKNADNAKIGDYVDIDFRCAGTPNADDAREHPVWHFFTKGGVLREGWTGVVGTIFHDDREQDEETDPPGSDRGK